MRNRLPVKSLSLATVLLVASSALLTVTVACSSSSSGTDGTTDAGPDATTDGKAPVDTGVIDEDSGDSVCPQKTPITAAEIEAAITWNPPLATQAVCSQQNLDDLKALFKSGSGMATFASIKSALGTACSDCVFTSITAANWSVFVEAEAGTIDNSSAACFAEVDGNACGKALFEFTGCLNVVCNTSVCANASAVSTCKTKASTGACATLQGAVQTACKGLQGDLTACSTLYQAITNTCAGGPDGGIDAAAP